MELAIHMNFTLNVVSPNDMYGYKNKSNNKWTGIMGKLETKEIDVAVAEISMTQERLEAFDFTCPLILSEAILFIKMPDSYIVKWDVYLKVYVSLTYLRI